VDPCRALGIQTCLGLALAGACGDPDCPDGTRYDGRLCSRVDAGTDAAAADAGTGGDAGSDGGCLATTEECNGADDDCDGDPDDDFECVMGAEDVTCTTACGSLGTTSCSSDCALQACSPPAESCNHADDDCDGVADEGLTILVDSHAFDPTHATTIRIEPTADGFVIVVHSEGTIFVQRLGLDGMLDGDPRPIVSGSAIWDLDTAIGGSGLIVGWSDGAGIRATVLATDDLSEVVSVTDVVSGEAGFVAIEADDANAVFAYLRAGSIRTVATGSNLSSPSSEKTIRTYEGSGRKFDFLAPSNGSIDWTIAYVSGSPGEVYFQTVRSNGNAVGVERRASISASAVGLMPTVADDGRGTLAVAWNAEETLYVSWHRQSDYAPITTNVGGELPPADFAIFRSHDIAYSAGRWVVSHLSGGAVHTRVYDEEGTLIAGGSGDPLSLSPASGAQELAVAANEGVVMRGVSTDGQTEAMPLGCDGP